MMVGCVQMAENPKEGAEELQQMLRSVATLYKQLARAATTTRVGIPPEARLGVPPAGAAAAASNGNAAGQPGPGPLIWDEYAAANAADWDDFKDEGGMLQSNRKLLRSRQSCPAINWMECKGPMQLI